MNEQQTLKKYGDIIHSPHHTSRKHPHLPMEARAAQFSPFSALNGHKETIQEADEELFPSEQ